MAAATTTPYALLGAQANSDNLQLRLAFREKIHQYKSDRAKEAAKRKINDSQFQQICRAYETLSDHDKRKQYDARQEWISDLHESKYTLQQLAAEPRLASQLKQRLLNAKLRQIDGQDPSTGHTPLYCAARSGNVDAVQYLIEQGADPDLKQRTGSTALHAASFFGHPDIVRCLLESGANYKVTNSSNNTPDVESFTTEVKQVFVELKQTAFVRAAANELDVSKGKITEIQEHVDTQYHVQRQTLLHCACKKGHFDLVKGLIEHHFANLDIVDINLNSALHLATYGGHARVVEYLLNQGANSTLLNKWGMSAEQEGLTHGTKITALFQSMRERSMFKMAKDGIDWWFQYYFGDHSPNTVDSDGTNILYVACRFGQTNVAKWLLDKGANVNAQLPKKRSTPLHGASFYKHKLTVELLLSRGADISIQNEYGATALEEVQADDIKLLLQQYRDNLSFEKYLSVHLYGDGSTSGKEPIAKVQLTCDATINDLIKAIPAALGNQYKWFSVARSPLNFDDKNVSLVSAVCRARYARTKFIDSPICLIAFTSPRYLNSEYIVREEFPARGVRSLMNEFRGGSKGASFHVKATSDSTQTFTMANLSFTFSPNCANKDILIKFGYIVEPDVAQFDLSECVCLFETQYDQNGEKLNDMPIVTATKETNVKLYTWISNSGHWFSYTDQPNRLPYIGGLHAFIRHVEIFPTQLYLLPGMFIQAAVGNLLELRQQPVPCQYLKICDPDSERFPHIAYHGTSISVIRSILMDGLVMANTVVSSGVRVCPPAEHIPRGTVKFGIDDFANAIFVSPSVHYSSDPAYAHSFTFNDQSAIAVLECRVMKDFFKPFPSTVDKYVAKPGDDINAIEWRIIYPAAIRITGVYFIPMIKSISEAAKLRANKLGLSSSAVA